MKVYVKVYLQVLPVLPYITVAPPLLGLNLLRAINQLEITVYLIPTPYDVPTSLFTVRDIRRIYMWVCVGWVELHVMLLSKAVYWSEMDFDKHNNDLVAESDAFALY